MGLFSKKTKNEEANQPPRNPNNTVMFRLLAVGYVGYLCFNMIQLYLEGGADAPSLTTLIVGIVVLGGGALFLAFLTYREWKVNKPAYDAYMAELRAEAEAKRAAEEAAEAQAALEDEEDDLLLEEATEETEDSTNEEE